LFLQDIKTDAAITVDIWVENLSFECNLQNYFPYNLAIGSMELNTSISFGTAVETI